MQEGAIQHQSANQSYELICNGIKDETDLAAGCLGRRNGRFRCECDRDCPRGFKSSHSRAFEELCKLELLW